MVFFIPIYANSIADNAKDLLFGKIPNHILMESPHLEILVYSYSDLYLPE
jgi:hypothetical protein